MASPDDDFDGANDPDPRSIETMDRIKELEGMNLLDLLTLGQKKLVADLVAKIEAGQASHQDMANLIKMLKDNGITLAIPKSDEQEEADRARPTADLPEYDDPEYER